MFGIGDKQRPTRREEYDGHEYQGGPDSTEGFTIDGKSWNYRDPANFNDGNDRASEKPTYNRDAYEMTNPLYEYSYGQMRDAANALDIENVDEKEEVDKLINYIQNPPTAQQTNSDEQVIKKDKPKAETPATPVAPSKEMTEAVQRSTAHKERMQGDRYNIYGGNNTSQFSERSKEVYDPNKGFEINHQTSVSSDGQEKAQEFMNRKINSTKKNFNFQPTLN